MDILGISVVLWDERQVLQRQDAQQVRQLVLVRNGTCMKCDNCGGMIGKSATTVTCNAPQLGDLHPINSRDAPQLSVARITT
jgi:hypothetical protein